MSHIKGMENWLTDISKWKFKWGMITEQVFCWDISLAIHYFTILLVIQRKAQRFTEDSVIMEEIGNKEKLSLRLLTSITG